MKLCHHAFSPWQTRSQLQPLEVTAGLSQGPNVRRPRANAFLGQVDGAENAEPLGAVLASRGPAFSGGDGRTA
jgi:hypothetical protein